MIDILLLRPETDWRLYPTVFLCALLVFGIIKMNWWVVVKAALVTALLYFVPMVLCGSAAICLAVALWFADLGDNSRTQVAEPSQSSHSYDNLRAPIEGAIVTEINNHTVQIDAKGLSFLMWKESDGTAFVQQLNEDGHTFGSKVSGAPNAWQFGMSVDESLAEYIKIRINQGGGL